MSAFIALSLFFAYCILGKSDLIIGAGLFAIAAEISCLYNKIMKIGENK